MDILYTVDERYLQAVEELNFGELPKALHYFNQILEIDPEYARAYYQIGNFYYYQFKDYQAAGYYLKKCITLNPLFPDVYVHYLKLLIALKMHQPIIGLAEKALHVPGVCQAEIYELLGNYAEQQGNFQEAEQRYQRALLATVEIQEDNSLSDHIKRVGLKIASKKKMIYSYQL